MNAHPRERLGAYLDRELPADEAAAVEVHLSGCTECSRELALMQQLGGAIRSMPTRYEGRSVWDGVHRRLTRPFAWILIVAGAAVWTALAAMRWMSEDLTLEWAAATAVIIGMAVLLVGIGFEQYRDWRDTRYRDVEQ